MNALEEAGARDLVELSRSRRVAGSVGSDIRRRAYIVGGGIREGKGYPSC